MCDSLNGKHHSALGPHERGRIRSASVRVRAFAYAKERPIGRAGGPCFRREARLGRRPGRNELVAKPSTECLQPSCKHSGRGEARRNRELALRWTKPAVDLDVRGGCYAAGAGTADLPGISWHAALQLAPGARRVSRWRRLVCHERNRAAEAVEAIALTLRAVRGPLSQRRTLRSSRSNFRQALASTTGRRSRCIVIRAVPETYPGLPTPCGTGHGCRLAQATAAVGSMSTSSTTGSRSTSRAPGVPP